jgi:hypothetical protein
MIIENVIFLYSMLAKQQQCRNTVCVNMKIKQCMLYFLCSLLMLAAYKKYF